MYYGPTRILTCDPLTDDHPAENVGLPISPDSIHRAAEEMIAEYGPEALAEAKEQAQDLRSVGFESVAKTWDLICAVIQDVDD